MATPETEIDNGTSESKQCCSIYKGNNDAKGYSWLAAGRGAIVMANIFLNASLLVLAKEAAGCELGEKCYTRVYGFYPSSWIANIASIASLVAGFFMPLFGAVIDYTDYRRAIGIITAGIMIVIQGVQIYTVEGTWFAMLLLQAVAVAFYFLNLVSVYAYLPEIAREFGEHTMASFTSNFQISQFGMQSLYLVLFAVITIIFKPTTVRTGQISQAINTMTSLIFFGVGWFKYLGPRNAVRELPKGHSLLLKGFQNNFETMKSIQTHFKKGVRWFFLAVCFAQAGT